METSSEGGREARGHESEAEWADRLRAVEWDEAAWRVFEGRCAPALLERAVELAGDVDLAVELLQRVRVSILGQKQGWCTGSVLGWAMRRLRFELRHWRRSENRRSTRREKASGALRRRPPTPEEVMERTAIGERIIGAVQALPVRQREAWVQRHFDGKEVKGIAEAMGISPRTVENLLYSAKLRLRELLGGEDGTE